MLPPALRRKLAQPDQFVHIASSGGHRQPSSKLALEDGSRRSNGQGHARAPAASRDLLLPGRPSAKPALAVWRAAGRHPRAYSWQGTLAPSLLRQLRPGQRQKPSSRRRRRRWRSETKKTSGRIAVSTLCFTLQTSRRSNRVPSSLPRANRVPFGAQVASNMV